MKSITFREITNQLTHPDFSHVYLISDKLEGVAEATSHHIIEEDTIEFYFEIFDRTVFSRSSMNAKTNGSSIFMVDVDGNSYELRLFKNVQMTF